MSVNKNVTVPLGKPSTRVTLPHAHVGSFVVPTTAPGADAAESPIAGMAASFHTLRAASDTDGQLAPDDTFTSNRS